MAIAAILNNFTLVWALTYVTDVSIIVQFLIALVGLGVAIDYALLMIFRFPGGAASPTTWTQDCKTRSWSMVPDAAIADLSSSPGGSRSTLGAARLYTGRSRRRNRSRAGEPRRSPGLSPTSSIRADDRSCAGAESRRELLASKRDPSPAMEWSRPLRFRFGCRYCCFAYAGEGPKSTAMHGSSPTTQASCPGSIRATSPGPISTSVPSSIATPIRPDKAYRK